MHHSCAAQDSMAVKHAARRHAWRHAWRNAWRQAHAPAADPPTRHMQHDSPDRLRSQAARFIQYRKNNGKSAVQESGAHWLMYWRKSSLPWTAAPMCPCGCRKEQNLMSEELCQGNKLCQNRGVNPVANKGPDVSTWFSVYSPQLPATPALHSPHIQQHVPRRHLEANDWGFTHPGGVLPSLFLVSVLRL